MSYIIDLKRGMAESFVDDQDDDVIANCKRKGRLQKSEIVEVAFDPVSTYSF